MKAIEVKSKDKVLYHGLVHEVVKTMLNSVVIKCSKGYKISVSYSQIEKFVSLRCSHGLKTTIKHR